MSGIIVVQAGSDPLDQLIDPDQVTRYGPNVEVVDNSGNNVTPAGADDPQVSLAVAQKNIKIQSPEHLQLLKGPPRMTMYGPDINLV